jgi:bifunctional DNA-binding transcriptional regulator/antitoxin component of YhaV-PrlF toxin-antitoxin module
MSRESIKKPASRKAAPKRRAAATGELDSVTVFSFVGNPGCIRFPQPVRKISGIKRDDRLLMSVRPDGTVVLEKREAVTPESMRQSILTAEVRKCSCPVPPVGCAEAEPLTVSVGWSYVQVQEPLATSLGLFANAPIRLVAEKSRISISRHDRLEDLVGIEPVRCPP